MPLDSIGYLSPTGYVETKIVDADGEVFLRAIVLLEERGWCQDPNIAAHIRGEVVPICIGLALQAPGSEPVWGSRIKRLGFKSGEQMVDWNDAGGRTKAEVIARLRSAAEQGAS